MDSNIPVRGRPVNNEKEEIVSNGLTVELWDAVKYEARHRNPKVPSVQVLREAVVHYLDHLASERGGTKDDERKSQEEIKES